MKKELQETFEDQPRHYCLADKAVTPGDSGKSILGRQHVLRMAAAYVVLV